MRLKADTSNDEHQVSALLLSSAGKTFTRNVNSMKNEKVLLLHAFKNRVGTGLHLISRVECIKIIPPYFQIRGV